MGNGNGTALKDSERSGEGAGQHVLQHAGQLELELEGEGLGRRGVGGDVLRLRSCFFAVLFYTPL